MNRKTISRYYRNTKTSQLCQLTGAVISVEAHEKFWKQNKVRTVRIPKRDFKMPFPRIGYSAEHTPIVSRKGLSIRRKHQDHKTGMFLSQYFYKPSSGTE